MKKLAIVVALVVVAALAVLGSSAVASGDDEIDVEARLSGFQEVPAVSTAGRGSFEAVVEADDDIDYRLSYSRLEGRATQAHIHFGQRVAEGGVIAWLCGGGGKPACPSSGTVAGEIRPAHIVGPAEQGIAPRQYAEAVRAILAGRAYANVHTTKFPDGEIRGQIKRD
jgi:hypothetical protein